MTSSPTRSISSSSRSAWTRTLEEARSSARRAVSRRSAGAGTAAGAGSAGAGGAAGAGAGASAAGAAAAGGAPSGVTASVMSSSTKTKTSSIARRGQSPSIVTDQPRWRSCGRSASSVGTPSNTARTVQGPRSRSSSISARGLVPLRRASGLKLKASFQPRPAGAGGAAGVGAGGAAPPALGAIRLWRLSRMDWPITASASSGVSISARMWSRAASATWTSSRLAATLPWRMRSKAVSKSCVKAASRSKPNIAPDPLIVCMARNAPSTRLRSPGSFPRSSSVTSRLSSSSPASWRKISAGSTALICAPAWWRRRGAARA